MKLFNRLDIFIRNPTTKLSDCHLSFAIYGFIFSVVFLMSLLVISWHTGEPNYLKYAGEVIAAIYAPTITAFTFNAHSKRKNGTKES